MMPIEWLPLAALEGLTLLFGRQLIFRRYRSGLQWLVVSSGIVYLMTVVFLCFRPSWIDPSLIHVDYHQVPINLIPFQNFHVDFFENILMTIPAGIYLALFYRHLHWQEVITLAILPGLTIESCQFFADFACGLYRVVDIDDLITNWLGVLIGFVIARFVINILPRHLRTVAFN